MNKRTTKPDKLECFVYKLSIVGFNICIAYMICEIYATIGL